MPIGTLSQKIHCHEIPDTTAPPTSGPIATARPAIPDHAPSASPRLSAGTAALRIVSVSGMTIAAPKPCTERAAINHSGLGASAAAAEAPVKSATPSMKSFFRPNRSPSAAPVRSSTAKVRVYALTVHSSPCRVAWRSLRITGSAVVTTRLSSVTMKSATEVIAKVQIVRVRGFMLPSFPSGVVIDHSFAGKKRERSHSASMQPSARRAAHESRGSRARE